MPATASVDTELVTNVKKALKTDPAKPMFFAMVLKGGREGKLIVNKAKIKPKQIEEAKKETGGSAVIKGLCFGEDGTLVFEVVKPPAPNVAAVVKIVLKAQAGLVLKVEFRIGRDSDSLAESDEPDLDVGGAPDAEEAEFKARLVEVKNQFDQFKAADAARAQPLTGLLMQADSLGQAGQFADATLRLVAVEEQIKQALAGKPADGTSAPASGMHRLNGLKPKFIAALSAGGPNVARIRTLFGAVTGLLKNNDTAQVDKVLDELEPLLEPSVEAGTADLGADFKRKLAEWTPPIKTAMTAKGPNAAAIGKLLAQAIALSKPGGDMVQAIANLTECHELAMAGAVREDESPAAAPGSPENTQAKWEKAFAAIELDYLQVVRDRPGAASQLRAVMGFAQGKAEAGNYPAAIAALQKLAELLGKTPAAPTSKGQPAPTATVGGDSAAGMKPDAAQFAKLWSTARASWQNASDTVDTQISQLQTALRAAGDEDLQEVAEFGLNGVTGDFKVPLMIAIREIDAAKGEALQPAIIKAKTAVANFQQHLQGSEQVLVCDENPFNVKVTIRAELGQALTQMGQALEAGA